MPDNKTKRSNVVFTLFSFGNQDTKGLDLNEGSIVFFGLGFRKDVGNYTCLPNPLGGVGYYNKTGKRDVKQYPVLEQICPQDIPDDLDGVPKINEYLVYPQFEDAHLTSLTTLSSGGKFFHNAYFYGKRIIFQRLGFQTELDCNSIPDDERFTLTLEWDEHGIGVWVSWVDQQNSAHTFENRITFDLALDLSTIAHIKLQLERLERHYASALSTKDPISFLDLAHCLRIWDDMKARVDTLLQQLDHHVEWENTPPYRKMKQALKGISFKYIPLSTGVESPEVQVKGIFLAEGLLTDDQSQALFKMGIPTAQKTALNFSEWLGAEIFEAKTSEGERLGISRGMLIRRVANILGASHPQGSDLAEDQENRFDSQVRELHQLEVANGYPLTYYQLIEIAGEIIKKLKPMWGE